MKLLFINVCLLFFIIDVNAQINCNRTFSPSLSLSYGLDKKAKPFASFEAGIWGKNAPVGFYGGFKVLNKSYNKAKDDTPAEMQGPMLIPTLSVTGKITTTEEYNFIHSPFITAGGKNYFGGGYRLYYLLGGTVMLGGELSYNSISKTNAGIILTAAL